MDLVVVNTVAEWRAWLARNCRTATEVWLVIQHKNSGAPSPRHHEAVEQALCFGWIDGLHRKRDTSSSQQRFTPRRPRSTWSRVNRERADRMIALGLMTPDGQAMIDLAKSTGRWEVRVPTEVRARLEEQPTFRRLPPSRKRLTLEWIASAKRPETRQRRLEAALQGGGPS